MSLQRCPYCGSTDLVVNPNRGDTVCGECAEILEEKAMVTEMTFTQGANGVVHAGGARMAPLYAPGPGGTLTAASEATISKGILKMSSIADRMQLSGQIQEAGRRMYQLAVQMNFNVGRPTKFVATACLYIICRRKKSPHLLIDFSDVIQAPVKVLGQVYIRLLRRLVGGDPRSPMALGDGVEVPVIDPSIFIERFARKLDLGSNQRKVQNTAMRLIQYMHRDWICLGRRPNGLCGAALLIAAHFHGQKCTAKDVSDVVRLGEDTLRKRLLELRHTPFHSLSREEFEKGDVQPLELKDGVSPVLPPCARERQLREERLALEDRGRFQALTDGTASEGAGTMPPPARPRGKKRGSKLEEEDQLASPFSKEVSTVSPNTARSSLASTIDRKDRDALFTERDPSENDIMASVKDIAAQLDIEGILAGTQTGGSSSSSSDPAYQASLTKIGDIVSGVMSPGPDASGLPIVTTGADDPTQPSDEPAQTAAPRCEVAATQRDESGDEEGLSDIEDEELDMYLLDEEERRDKSDIWHEVNKDYLEEWYVRGRESRKRKQQAAAQMAASQGLGCASADDCSASETGSQPRNKRWRPRAESCTQSAVMALAKKGKVGASRINIEALESLFS